MSVADAERSGVGDQTPELKTGGGREVGYEGETEGRPHRLPLADPSFVDPEAGFVYVRADRVMAVAEGEGAIPFDVAGVKRGHYGEECSLVATRPRYGLRTRR